MSPAESPAGAVASPSGPAVPEREVEVVLRTIASRRSAAAWLPEAPPRATIERLIESANTAPNHKLTQPWRFFVLRGDARLEYASALASDQIAFDRAGHAGQHHPNWEAHCRETLAQNLLRAPVVIAAGSVPAQVPGLPEWEDLAASAAAVQNLLLAAHALGLAAAWKSRACPLSTAAAWLGLPPHAQLIGHVLLGYADPAVPLKPKERKPAAALTAWLGWDG